MKSFKDNLGRDWTIAVNVDAIKRVKGLLDVDLRDVVQKDNRLIERLYSDELFLCDVAYVLVKPEADAKNISDEDFGRAMAGDTLEFALAAIMGELSDFFRKPEQREALRKAIAKLNAFQDKLIAVINQQLDDPALDQELDKLLSQASQRPASNA